MAKTTSNTAVCAELNTLLNDLYAMGKQITDLCTIQGISNTAMVGVCSEIKNARLTTNTQHAGILLLLANT